MINSVNSLAGTGIILKPVISSFVTAFCLNHRIVDVQPSSHHWIINFSSQLE